MDIKIWDALGDDCVGEGGVNVEHALYRWLWLTEQYLRCSPREMIHITPIRGYGIEEFDIGDLITVTAGAQVRGGFSGVQRVYEYTISWEEDGPLELSELQTSPNNEGLSLTRPIFEPSLATDGCGARLRQEPVAASPVAGTPGGNVAGPCHRVPVGRAEVALVRRSARNIPGIRIQQHRDRPTIDFGGDYGCTFQDRWLEFYIGAPLGPHWSIWEIDVILYMGPDYGRLIRRWVFHNRRSTAPRMDMPPADTTYPGQTARSRELVRVLDGHDGA